MKQDINSLIYNFCATNGWIQFHLLYMLLDRSENDIIRGAVDICMDSIRDSIRNEVFNYEVELDVIHRVYDELGDT